ncbi:MAG: histidinol-phosphate transaminase [Beggiatoa sp. IS2]|nr:MAG: histidinol-phosphate transaminase [Beggiatoa sp. IS2]
MGKVNPTISWVRPEIQQISPYHVLDTTGITVKLDAMENPYGWDEVMMAEWLEVLRTASLNRYPDSQARELKQQLRETLEIPDNMEIIVGNGSDELIQMLLLTLNMRGRTLIIPEPTFSMYSLLAQVVGMQIVDVALEESSFNLDVFAWLEAIENYQPALTFLAYPNNPTGNAFAVADIEVVIESSSGLVVIDEAYAPFADNTFLPRLKDYPNLLVMRTLSKLGLAGLRLGYLVGPKVWLEQIEKTRLPYNINVLTQLSVKFALQHYNVLKSQAQQIKAERASLLKNLQAIKRVKAWNSQTNFILFRVRDALSVFNGLKERGILIKNLHGSHPLLDNCLRVTVGTSEENQVFLQELTSLVS